MSLFLLNDLHIFERVLCIMYLHFRGIFSVYLSIGFLLGATSRIFFVNYLVLEMLSLK
jgi:hypothetical protein